MAVTLLGREALLAVLAGHGRVIVVNRTSPRLGLRVMAAAIARHAAADVQCESAFGLDLDSGESEILDALPAATGALAAVEAVLRLAAPESGVFGDVYVTSPVEPPRAARAWEIGIRDRDGPLAPGEVVPASLWQCVAYLRPVS
jgi:hypothetical protein